jgi:hypothetical protein
MDPSLAKLLEDGNKLYAWSDLARTKIAFSLTFAAQGRLKPMLDDNKMTEASTSSNWCLVFRGRFRDDGTYFKLEIFPTNTNQSTVRHVLKLYVGHKFEQIYIGDLYIFF